MNIFYKRRIQERNKGRRFALKKGETKNTEQVDKKEKRDQRVD